MGMGNQHGVDPSQSILWEPLDSGCLEVFANVDNNRPEIRPFLSPHQGVIVEKRTSFSRLSLRYASP
jgi:hypothetical protein